MENEVIGIVYSQIHGQHGPETKVYIPETLPTDITYIVPIKSLSILAGEKGMVPKTLATIPFPSLNLKGIIKILEIRDPDLRGGATETAITILYSEVNDLIFYKYIKNFEKIINKYANKIIELEEGHSNIKEIENALKNLYNSLQITLEDLRNAELSAPEEKLVLDGDTIDKNKNLGFRFKLIVYGDPEVGKTSIVLKFTNRAFRRTYIPTLGVNISEKLIRYKNSNIVFIIWDIAGQTRFLKMRKHFYTGAEAQILVLDLTRISSLKNLADWYNDVSKYIGNGVPGIILANKNDLIEDRQVTEEDIIKLAKELNFEYFETSALTGQHINESFYKIGEILFYKYKFDKYLK